MAGSSKELNIKLIAAIDKILKKSPTLQDILTKITSYRPLDPKNIWVHSGVGGAVGGYIGASKDVENPARGAAVGAGSGALFLASLPKLIQRGVGRVVTNLIYPYGYDIKNNVSMLLDAAKHHSKNPLRLALESIIKDKPIASYLPRRRVIDSDLKAYFDQYNFTPREIPYRLMFGLRPRIRSSKLRNFFIQDTAVPSVWHYNLDNPTARKELRQIAAALRGSSEDIYGALEHYNPKLKHVYLQTYGLTPGAVRVNLRTGEVHDFWDLNLDPSEKINSFSQLSRALVSMFTEPITLKGKIDLPRGIEPKVRTAYKYLKDDRGNIAHSLK